MLCEEEQIQYVADYLPVRTRKFNIAHVERCLVPEEAEALPTNER